MIRDIMAGLLLPLGAALALIAATVAVFVRATEAEDDRAAVVDPAPVYWQQGEPFNAESVVAEPKGVVR